MSGAAGKGLAEQDWRPPCQREGSLLSSKERGMGVGMIVVLVMLKITVMMIMVIITSNDWPCPGHLLSTFHT